MRSNEVSQLELRGEKCRRDRQRAFCDAKPKLECNVRCCVAYTGETLAKAGRKLFHVQSSNRPDHGARQNRFQAAIPTREKHNR